MTSVITPCDPLPYEPQVLEVILVGSSTKSSPRTNERFKEKSFQEFITAWGKTFIEETKNTGCKG